MRLFSQYAAEKLVRDLSSNELLSDEKLLSLIAEERTRLLGTGIKVIVFLFTTITLIAITIFDVTEGDSSLFGMKISNPDAFAFSAFMVGNVLYVVSTGLFLKLFIMEFIILEIVNSKEFKDDSEIYAFIRSFHANVMSFLIMFGFLQNFPKQKMFFKIINFYAKYYILIAYGVYYYFVLGYFLLDQLEKENYFFLSVLIASNIMSILTSFAIFFPLREKQTLPQL